MTYKMYFIYRMMQLYCPSRNEHGYINSALYSFQGLLRLLLPVTNILWYLMVEGQNTWLNICPSHAQISIQYQFKGLFSCLMLISRSNDLRFGYSKPKYPAHDIIDTQVLVEILVPLCFANNYTLYPKSIRVPTQTSIFIRYLEALFLRKKNT